MRSTASERLDLLASPGVEIVVISKIEHAQDGISEKAMTVFLFFSLQMGCPASPCLSCPQLASSAVLQAESTNSENSYYPETSTQSKILKFRFYLSAELVVFCRISDSQDLTGGIPVVSFNMFLCPCVLVNWWVDIEAQAH